MKLARACVRIASIVLLLALPQTALLAHADGAWLDRPLRSWNTAGAPMPTAPPAGPYSFTDCPDVRPAETDMDAAVADAGWLLFNPYQSGWGVTLVDGTDGFDGMCRPAFYQTFVFVDGTFAGTLAPEPTAERSDGAGFRTTLGPGPRITESFARYAPNDAACCPSRRSSTVEYSIGGSPDSPVVIPMAVSREPGP